MANKQKTLEEIQNLHTKLMAELDKVIAKLDNYNRGQMAEHREDEKKAMDQILDKIKKDL